VNENKEIGPNSTKPEVDEVDDNLFEFQKDDEINQDDENEFFGKILSENELDEMLLDENGNL